MITKTSMFLMRRSMREASHLKLNPPPLFSRTKIISRMHDNILDD